MIVKNESRVILRLLESVVSLIDAYVICDTGSTDETVDIIRSFFAAFPTISGKITYESFRDFGHNRTLALRQCREFFPDVEYVLLLDADMIFKLYVSPAEFREWLVRENSVMIRLFQGNPYFSTENARIVRNLGFRYRGVTHEYLDIPTENVPEGMEMTVKMPKTVAEIWDLGDGGAKTDKFERDIRLLKQGIQEEPDMRGRYLFYLGNSLKDIGRNTEAIDIYRQKIAEGGWIEEIWHSWFSMGQCYKHLHKYDEAVSCWLQAYDVFPNRIENLYEICRLYREENKHRLAFIFYDLSMRVKRTHPNPEFLFTQLDVYRFRLDYELTIFGYYWNPLKEPLGEISMQLISMPEVFNDRPVFCNILSNYKFYSVKIADLPGVGSVDWKAVDGIDVLAQNQAGEFVSSTPSVVWYRGQIWVNVRWVNYRIGESGEYINREHIHTRNVLHCISLAAQPPKELRMNPVWDGRYVGAEDVRLFTSPQGELEYTANRGLDFGPQNMCVEYGRIDVETGETHSVLLSSANSREIEKNWVLATDGVKTQVIYSWGPLVIGEAEDGIWRETFCEMNVPAFFQDLRGSTNGVLIAGEIWFICHLVSYEDRRFYYHVFVILDAATWKLKRYSPLMTFMGEKVEYTLGMIYRPEKSALDIGFSIMDRTTKFMQVPLNAIPWVSPPKAAA